MRHTITRDQVRTDRAQPGTDGALQPYPSFPRPDRDRSSAWLNLNGTWDFLADDCAQFGDAAALPDGEWDAGIVVPYSWETQASGVVRSWLETAWYRTTFTLPEAWLGRRAILNFGAVHHEARVWVNGAFAGSHAGGYTPFEFDITDAAGAAASGSGVEVVVRVSAPSDKREIVHGKQRSIPRDDYDGVSFTPTSGIWQGVWVEARPSTHATVVSLRGDSLDGIDAVVTVGGPNAGSATVTVRAVDRDGRSVEGVASVADGRAGVRLPIVDPVLWSPEDPHLYSVTVTVTTSDGTDTVGSFAGLRSIERDGERLLLNGEPLYLRGVLDQGYWPGSGLTAPDESALELDIDRAADAGYNLVRKHLKFEDPRWLHAADVKGMLVWAEPASTSRFLPAAVDAFEEQIEAMVERDGNHPSVIVWGLYNEEWGMDWDIPGDPDKGAAVERAYDLLAELDSSRPIVDNSGWTHVKTDLVDWHCYDESPAGWAARVAALADGSEDSFPVRLAPDYIPEKAIYADDRVPRTGIPFLNSEYGGGFTNLERGWHLRWQTQELRRHNRIAGYVYTELADVEHETAGFLYADRSLKDLGGFPLSMVNAETTLVLDVVPLEAGTDCAPGQEAFDVPVHVSHHGRATLVGRIASAWTPAGSPLPEVTAGQVVPVDLAVSPFVLSDAATVQAVLPDDRNTGRLWIWFEVDGARVAHAFLDVGVLG